MFCWSCPNMLQESNSDKTQQSWSVWTWIIKYSTERFLFTQCLKSFLFLPNSGLNGTFHSRNMKLKHVFGSSVLEFVWLTCWSWYVLTWSLMFILCVTCNTFGLFCKWALASVVLIDGVSATVDNTLWSRHQGPNFPLIVVQQNHILLLQKVITRHALFGFW